MLVSFNRISHGARAMENPTTTDSTAMSSMEEARPTNGGKTNSLKQDASPKHKKCQSKSRFTVECVQNDAVHFHLGEVNDGMTPDLPPSGRSVSISSEVIKHDDDDVTPPPYHLADHYDRTYCYQKTLETLPNADHYQMAEGSKFRQRPKLSELLAPIPDENQKELKDEPLAAEGEFPEEIKPLSAAPKFGWIVGVFVRCLLNIFGVMLFLRISWVVGQAGLGLGTIIILLASLVTILTALSMSAISTNGEVRGGGAYYMISRTLGPEFGGAIGIVFALANAVAVAMYVVGFAETIRDILKKHDRIMFDDMNDVRVIGLITVFFLLGITLAGLSWEAKAQLILLVILTVAIVNFIVGSFFSPSEEKIAQGFTGYSVKNFKDNFVPDFRDGYQFFTVFAIYFPAATGILAGANISGDLKDAQKAIPKGTLLAILVTTIVYLGVAWIAGLCVERDAPGLVTINLNETLNGTTEVAQFFRNSSLPGGSLSNTSENFMSTCEPGKPNTCEYGLLNNMQVTQLLSGFAPLTIAGIISATISSALASLVSAPKVFQAVCRDKIFPFIGFFGKGYGKGEEPRRAYVLTFVIGAACICIGDLNSIAPLISNFFLMSYGLINYSCFDASLAKSPGWRPAFKYYSLWFSLAGALLCVVVMFIMSWETALATFALVAGLYLYVHYRKPDINWGSSTQAKVYLDALRYTQKLVMVLEHVKNFRPQVLVLSGYPSHRPAFVDFCSAFTKSISLMICGHVMLENSSDRVKSIRTWTEMANRWLHRRKSKAFYSVVTAKTLRMGVQAMMQSSGLGKLRPNTLMIGFKSNWRTSSYLDVDDYFNIILDAFDLNYGVGILRLREGLDYSHLTKLPAEGPIQEDASHLQSPLSLQQLPPPQQNSSHFPLAVRFSSLPHLSTSNIGSQRSLDSAMDECDGGSSEAETADYQGDQYLTVDIKQAVNRFHCKRQEGYIDVWWLFDDGGLTVLIPYLLSTKKHWSHCKLRVFTAGSDQTTLDRERLNLATLLHKFRIEYSTTNVISGMDKKPSLESLQEFDRLIEDWVLNRAKGEKEETHPWKITEQELQAQKEKTCRYLRLREMLRQQSLGASFVFLTLPMPRKGTCSASLYMAWIEFLTRDMPPILLLRGNQESVLTYYS